MSDSASKVKTNKSVPSKKAKKMNPQQVTPPGLPDFIDTCLSHAEDLLCAAKKIQNEVRLHHIAFHLATLALEEIGKASLVTMGQMAKIRNGSSSWAEKHIEDHVKKLFWALWGPSFGRELITKDQIESIKGLAQRIHDTRLRGLYVDAKEVSSSSPKDAVTESETKDLISLVQNRLKIEKNYKFSPLNKAEKQDMSWFLDATGDSGKRHLIFGLKSMEKLVEFGRTSKWIRWLRKQFEEAEAVSRALAERELKRPKPSNDEALHEKWKFKLRFHTNSHSIRPKPLNYWNNIADWLKLYPVDKKKKELLVEFTLPKAVSVQQLWWIGWGISRKFIISLNIGSLGFFWWYIPQQVSQFYESLKDIEQDNGIVVKRSPQLKLDWKGDILSEQHLINTALCFSLIPGRDEHDQHEPFNHYIAGLGFLSKNDIHLQFEANAYDQFYKTLKSAMRLYKDWDGIAPFSIAFNSVISDIIPDKDKQKEFLDLGAQFEQAPVVPEGIALNEACCMKMLCDAYFIKTFRRLAMKKKEEKTI